jgi:hypothetical protein
VKQTVGDDRTRRRAARTAGLLLLVHAGWLAWSATWQSPTLNEPGHLASGLAHWTLARFEPYAVNPPLVRMVAALPVMAAGYQADWSALRGRPGERSEFQLGNDFIHANRKRSQWLFELARWVCIPFSVLGGWMCFLWGRAIFTPAAGVLACALWCFEPNIIAHGQLITPDVAATSLGLVAMWFFWRWLSQPDWTKAALSGASLGFAILAKSSWIILPPLWLLITVVRGLVRRRETAARQACSSASLQFGASLLVALYVLNLAYGFDGSVSRLGSFDFSSRTFSGRSDSRTGNRFQQSWASNLPVPLPRQFVLGLDLQQRDFEAFPHRSYLRGEWKHGGWPHYYLYALAVKTPIGLWLLGLTAVTWGIVRCASPGRVDEVPQRRDRAMGIAILALPAVLLFVTVSSQRSFNHHFRYVLPCFGPAIVLISSVALSTRRSVRLWTLGCTLWLVVSSASVAPHSLSYFNELAGGPRNGSAHLLHSNVDWGQGLIALDHWMKQHPERRPMFLAYHGFYSPTDWGLDVQPPPQGPFWDERPHDRSFRPGWYAISVNYLRGAEWRLDNRDAYRPLLDHEPSAWCGGAIAMYQVDEQLAAELTKAAFNRTHPKK